MKKTHFLLLSFLLLLLVDDAKAQLKLGDQPTSVQKSVILDLQGSNGRQGVWLPRVSDTTDATGIDGLNPPDGILIYHTPGAQVMIRKNGYWNSLQTTTKVGTTTSTHSIIEFQLGTAAGASKDVNYNLNSSTGVITLNIPDAAVDTRGLVTIGSQAFGGVKTFNDGLTSLSTTTISGASSNASNLYLGISSATTPGTTTDRVLSVDNSGRVVLSQSIPSTRTMTINGTSYDLSANRTWNVGTVTSLTGGYGLNGGTITSSGTLSLDTSAISTRAWRQKGIDSLAALMGNYLSNSRMITINGTAQDLSANRTWNVGTVTSVGAGYGLTGGTITATGTHAVDTFSISTRAWRQKGIDSVAALVNGFVPSTRSINGLSLAFNHTFSVGASGTDFNIVSGGSTHTFNMPTASATNRGLLSTSDWTNFNNKVSSTRTINGLALSNDQTFATGTSGTDFNISSTGTTHTFNIPNASATARGAVSTGAQTFAGVKTFSTGVTVSGATSNASNLTLGITSATTPGASTDRYLTVDNTGKVILSSVSGVSSLTSIGASPNANGATLSSGVLNLQPASSSFGGVVTTGTQSFAGSKTFDNTVSARVNLQAGTATAGTAPLKFTSGTNLSTPENGAVEFDGTNYYATSGGVRYTLAKTLTATAVLDFPATSSGGGTSTRTITVTGAALGDVVSLGIPAASVEAGGTYYAYVSAANTVTIVLTNAVSILFGGTIDPDAGTFRVSVTKY